MADRSRSPLRQTEASERLVRQVAAFTLDARFRPAGLEVDATGALRLRDVVEKWGRQQGLKERDILHALRAHMFHDPVEGEPVQLRFAMDSDPSTGHVLFRAHAWREGLRRRVPARAPALAPLPSEESPQPQGGAPQATPKMRGSALLQMASRDRLLDTPLEALIDAQPRRPRELRVRRAVQQMGLAAPARGGDRERRAGERPGAVRSAGEQIQRWLGWVLHSGHAELDVPVDRGWAHLDELAAAMGRSRPDFGEFDGERLRAVLQETDLAGRFEFGPSGLVRKVPKGGRLPPTGMVAERSVEAGGRARPAATPCAAAPLPVAFTQARRRPGGSASTSPSPARDDADDCLARACAETLRISPAAAPAGSAVAVDPGVAGAEAEKPPPPPGEHWKRYHDDGSFWWHYHGPLGQWWCTGAGSAIEPYEP